MDKDSICWLTFVLKFGFWSRKGILICVGRKSIILDTQCPVFFIRNDLWYLVDFCSIPLHSTPLHSTQLHSTPLHSTPLHSTPLHSTPLHSTPLHSTPLHSTPLHSTPLHSTPLHSTPLHSTPLHSTTQHNTTQHSTTQHNTTQEKTTLRNLPSDHYAVLCSVAFAKPAATKSQYKQRRLRDTDLEALEEDILNSPLSKKQNSLDTNKLVSLYNTELLHLLDKHAPEVLRSITLRPHSPWYSVALRDVERKKRRCEHAYRASGLEIHR